MSKPKIAKVVGEMITRDSTVTSPNSDFAELAEWTDGNTSNESRIGYFVSLDTSTTKSTICKSTSTSSVRGVTISCPGFSSSVSLDKFDKSGNLLPKYVYVGFAGFVPVIDKGNCTVNARCMPGDDGTAIPSTNNLGYIVAERLDENRILILLEGNTDEVQRLRKDLSGHTHAWSAITGKPSILLTSDIADWAKASTKPTYTYSEVKAAPENHTHEWSDIKNKPASMPASDVYAWAKASTKPSYTYSEVGAAEKGHTHSYLPLSGGTITGALYLNSSLTLNSTLYASSGIVVDSLPSSAPKNKILFLKVK